MVGPVGQRAGLECGREARCRAAGRRPPRCDHARGHRRGPRRVRGVAVPDRSCAASVRTRRRIRVRSYDGSVPRQASRRPATSSRQPSALRQPSPGSCSPLPAIRSSPCCRSTAPPRRVTSPSGWASRSRRSAGSCDVSAERASSASPDGDPPPNTTCRADVVPWAQGAAAGEPHHAQGRLLPPSRSCGAGRWRTDAAHERSGPAGRVVDRGGPATGPTPTRHGVLVPGSGGPMGSVPPEERVDDRAGGAAG